LKVLAAGVSPARKACTTDAERIGVFICAAIVVGWWGCNRCILLLCCAGAA
jgi:hypothetical protein